MTKCKWLGSRQRAVLALFKNQRYVSRREVQDACPWAGIEFFLDRTLTRLEEKGWIKFTKFRGYELVAGRRSGVWRQFVRRV